MLFTGTYQAKMDAKGRVFLPSDYRRQLHEAGSGIVLRRDLFQPCLVVSTRQVWLDEAARLRACLNGWNRHEAQVLRRFMADVESVSLDASGRLLLPRRLQDFCRIDREVSFLGSYDRIEVWSTALLEATLYDDNRYAEAVEQLMGTAHTEPAATPTP